MWVGQSGGLCGAGWVARLDIDAVGDASEVEVVVVVVDVVVMAAATEGPASAPSAPWTEVTVVKLGRVQDSVHAAECEGAAGIGVGMVGKCVA